MQSGCLVTSETTYFFELIAMARVTEKGIVGLVGNLVFYTVNGKTYVRSKPGKRKKKRGQKVKPLNSVFGTVSRYGTAMLNAVKEHLSFALGRDGYNKARGYMRNHFAERGQDITWELSVKNSGMCQLNAAADLRDFFREEITVSDRGKGKIVLSVPSFNPKLTLKLPIRSLKANLKLIAVTSPFKETGPRYSLCIKQCSFTLNQKSVPATELTLNAGSPKDIALIIVAMEFETEDQASGQVLKDIKWLPAAIIAMGRLKK